MDHQELLHGRCMEISNLVNNGLRIRLSLESSVTNRFALTDTEDNYLNMRHDISLSLIETDGICFPCKGANSIHPDVICSSEACVILILVLMKQFLVVNIAKKFFRLISSTIESVSPFLCRFLEPLRLNTNQLLSTFIWTVRLEPDRLAVLQFLVKNIFKNLAVHLYSKGNM